MDRLGEPIVTLSHDISLFIQNNSEELCKQNQAINGIWVGYLTKLGLSCSKDWLDKVLNLPSRFLSLLSSHHKLEFLQIL